MFYFLSDFTPSLSFLNVFQYISFRSGGAFLTSLGMTLLLCRPFIRWLKSHRISQSIREYAPPAHQFKTGTPPMGGLVIYAAMLIASLLWARLDNRFVLWILGGSTFLCLFGFMDDYQKWVKQHHSGIAPWIKMTAQVALGLSVAAYLYFNPSNVDFVTRINIPYLKERYLDLGMLYILLVMFVVVGSSNAVNLTDGLDGLAIGSLVISALTYGVFAYLAGNAKFSQYLRIIPVPGAGELTVILAAMAGAGIGFLWFNAHPAEIFMGDTGSLYLGGAIGLVAIFVKQELLLILVGGVFVAEALSVLIQVYVFQTRGTRFFRMAPLHHHFELGGVPETKVTIRFWIVAVVLSLVAMTALKVR